MSSMGIGLTTPLALGRERTQLALNAIGQSGETYNRASISSGAAMTAQQIQGWICGFRAGDVVSNIQSHVQAAPATPANLTAFRLCVFKKDGTLLAITADCSTTFQTTGIKSVAIASTWNGAALGAGSSYTIPSDDGYYLAAWADGTSMPSLGRAGSVTGQATPVGTGSFAGVVQNTIAVATLTAAGGFTATFGLNGTTNWFGWS